MRIGIAVELKDGCFSGTDGRIEQDAVILRTQVFPSVFDRIMCFQAQPFGRGFRAFHGFDIDIDPVDDDFGIELF